MAIAPLWLSNLVGTVSGYFKIGGFTGVRLKNSAGDLLIRNTGDSADAKITTSQLKNSGDSIIVNSDAAGSGADWLLTLARPSSGQTAAWTFTFPIGPGTANYVLQTDGSGNTSWVAAGSTAACISVDTTTLAFNTSSPLTLFTLPANAVIDWVEVIVDTAFDGTTPSVTIGISGTTSKYQGAGDNDLATLGGYRTYPGIAAAGGTEALIATFTAGGGATVGSARILVAYTVPA